MPKYKVEFKDDPYVSVTICRYDYIHCHRCGQKIKKGSKMGYYWTLGGVHFDKTICENFFNNKVR